MNNITHAQWIKLFTISGISLTSLVLLLVTLPGDSAEIAKDKLTRQYPILFAEMNHFSQENFQKNFQKKVSEEINNQNMLRQSLETLIEHEFRIFVENSNAPTHAEKYSKEEQQAAFDTSKERLEAAITSGVWRNEDTHALLPHVEKIPAEKRIELLELYYGALNENTITQDPNRLPPPL